MTDDRNRTSVLRQLAALENMKLAELQEKWRDLYGSEPPRFKSRFLKKRLAYRIQELFYGSVDSAVKEKIKELAASDPMASKLERPCPTTSNGKVLPGTRFIREWNGKTYETIARDDGFEYNGQMFRSLTAIATAITGTKWNGRRWWGVSNTKKSEC
jgi:hypothetical protein